MFCALCGDHARHAKSPRIELRRKECPRFPGGVIHRGCCAGEPCSLLDTRGHVRCGWDAGGRERLAAHLHALEGRSAQAGLGPGRQRRRPADAQA